MTISGYDSWKTEPDVCPACEEVDTAAILDLNAERCPKCGRRIFLDEYLFDAFDDAFTAQRIGADWSVRAWHVGHDVYIADEEDGEHVSLLSRTGGDPAVIRDGIPLADALRLMPAMKRLARMRKAKALRPPEDAISGAWDPAAPVAGAAVHLAWRVHPGERYTFAGISDGEEWTAEVTRESIVYGGDCTDPATWCWYLTVHVAGLVPALVVPDRPWKRHPLTDDGTPSAEALALASRYIVACLMSGGF